MHILYAYSYDTKLTSKTNTFLKKPRLPVFLTLSRGDSICPQPASPKSAYLQYNDEKEDTYAMRLVNGQRNSFFAWRIDEKKNILKGY